MHAASKPGLAPNMLLATLLQDQRALTHRCSSVSGRKGGISPLREISPQSAYDG